MDGCFKRKKRILPKMPCGVIVLSLSFTYMKEGRLGSYFVVYYSSICDSAVSRFSFKDVVSTQFFLI